LVAFTTSGNCIDNQPSSVRFDGRIVDGAVQYIAADTNNVSGRVTPSGAASMVLTFANNYAVGSGRMTENAGSGVWHGKGPNGRCAGTWTAERR
jgi:hypothetical protein